MPSRPGLRRQARRIGGGSGVNGVRRRRIRSAANPKIGELVGARHGSTCPGQRTFGGHIRPVPYGAVAVLCCTPTG